MGTLQRSASSSSSGVLVHPRDDEADAAPSEAGDMERRQRPDIANLNVQLQVRLLLQCVRNTHMNAPQT